MDGSSTSYNIISNAITILKFVPHGLNEKI
jgi:hypothetical protein